MSAPLIEPGYPLSWPMSRPRTRTPGQALFRNEGARITLTAAKRRLDQQVQAITPRGKMWRITGAVLSTNIRYTASGARDRNVSRRDPDDAGVAFYFELDGKPHVLACDRWDTVADNIAAIAAHIEALRGQERWGVADLAQAFAGHVALPAPDPWWAVLGIARQASRAEIDSAYRREAKDAHPDRGGDRAAWDRLQAAYDAGKAERPA